MVGSLLIMISCLHHYPTRSRPIQIIGIIASISVLFSIGQDIADYFYNSLGINELGMVFVVFEALLMAAVFYSSVVKYILFRRIILVLTILCLIYFGAIFMYSNYPMSFIHFGRDLLVVLLSIVYLYFLILELPEENLLKLPMFWICAVSVFYFSGTFTLSVMFDYIVKVLKNDMTVFWAFRNFFRFAFCLGIAYAGWLDWQKVKLKAKGDS
jgi:hypothetical protein